MGQGIKALWSGGRGLTQRIRVHSVKQPANPYRTPLTRVVTSTTTISLPFIGSAANQSQEVGVVQKRFRVRSSFSGLRVPCLGVGALGLLVPFFALPPLVHVDGDSACKARVSPIYSSAPLHIACDIF